MKAKAKNLGLLALIGLLLIGVVALSGCIGGCGDLNQNCCEGDKCNSEDLVCSEGKCLSCGGVDEICCEDNKCDEGVCIGGKCEECGGIDELCCEGSNCYEGVCSDSKCVPKLQGKLISAETQEPLDNAALILCRSIGEYECTLQANLISLTEKDGTFEFSGVPPGQYVVLYYPSQEAITGWKNIDQQKINYKLIGEKPHKYGSISYTSGYRFTPYTPSNRPTLTSMGSHKSWCLEGVPQGNIYIPTKFYYSFCGGGCPLSMKIENITITEGVITSMKGLVITSYKYGLVIQIDEVKPIMVDVKLREINNIEIRAEVTMADLLQ